MQQKIVNRMEFNEY